MFLIHCTAGLDEKKWMEQLIAENPNPLLRVGKDGKVLYANRASAPLLNEWKVHGKERLPLAIGRIIQQAATLKSTAGLDIKAGDRAYRLTFTPVPEAEEVNIYGLEITPERQNPTGEKQLCQEIPEMKTADEPLRNRLIFLEKLFESLPNPIFYKDRENRYTDCNEKFARQILGLPKEEILGHKTSELFVKIPQELIASYQFEDESFLNCGGTQVYEIELMCADSIKRNFLVRRNSISNEKEQIMGMLWIMIDLTEIRMVDGCLQNQVNFLKSLLDTIPAPVFYKNREGRYLGCNGLFARQILGKPKEEIIDHSVDEFEEEIPKNLAEIYKRQDLELFWKGGTRFYEAQAMCADGKMRDFLLSKATYTDNSGEVTGLVGVMQDITRRKRIEETLQRSEEKFRIAAEQTGQIIYDYNIKSDRNDWAGAIKELTGYSPEEFQNISGEEWENHIHPEDRKGALEEINKALKSGKKKFYVEYRFRRKNGSYFYVEDSGVYLRNEKGCPRRMIGVMKDITERKLVMEKLQKSEEKYRMAAEQTGQLIYDYNIASDQNDWAGAIKELTGYGSEEFQKLTLRMSDLKKHIHPEDQERAFESHQTCLKTGERHHEEYRFRRKNGSYFYVEDTGNYFRDERGSVYRALGIIKDITERKIAVEKLLESEERYRSFVQNFRGIAFHLDMNYSPIIIGGNVEEITGYTKEDFLSGKIQWRKIIEPEDISGIYTSSEKLQSVPNYTEEWEYRIVHKDGKKHWVHEITRNICDPAGRPVIIQVSIYDINERKIAEKALSQAEEIRKKEIHHRIKNNLQVISSLLSLQSEYFKDKDVVEAFRESQNRVESMSLIHEELYKSGDMETIDFSAYLQRLTAELLQSYKVGNEEVHLKLDTEEVFFGMDTAIPLGIIINELVSNSLKYGFPDERAGEIHVILSRGAEKETKNLCNSTSDITDINNNLCALINNKSGNLINNNPCDLINNNPSNLYTLIVRDTGVGFPEGLDFKNTVSLGLQLVNILVDQLDGCIELDKGTGTAFKISFKEV